MTKKINDDITTNQKYVLLLNNCYDTRENDQICQHKYSVLRGVLEKEYTDFSTLDQDMLGLDDSITIGLNSWLVSGSFPVIAEEHHGEMINCATGRTISYDKDGFNTLGLSYCEKYPISNVMASMLLNMLGRDYEAVKRYHDKEEALEDYALSNQLNQNKRNKIYGVFIDTDEEEKPVIISKDGKNYVEIVSGKTIYQSRKDEISSNITFSIMFRLKGRTGLVKIAENSLEETLVKMDEFERLAKYEYQNYKFKNAKKTFATRTGSPLVRKMQKKLEREVK